jgi:tetratricopeptide (TPR) repeat protein
VRSSRTRATSFRAALLAGAVGLTAACGGDRDSWRSRVVPIPEPDLARHEESVRAKVRAARARVDQELSSSRATPATAAAAFGELGRVTFPHDLWDTAKASLTNAATLAPQDPRWPYLLGVIAQMEGHVDVAAGHLEQALALHPGDGPTLVRLGQVELDRGRPADARRQYEQALAVTAMAPAARFGLGRIAAAEGDLAAAVRHFEQVLAAQPGATIVHNALGLALRGLGRRDEARQHLEKAGRVAVTFPDPVIDELSDLVTGARSYLRRGTMAEQAGDVEQALVEYRKAVQVEPGLAAAHYSLGTLLGKKGDFAEAITHLQRGIASDPTSPEAFDVLATALLAQGRTDEALAALDRVLALDASNHSARVRRAAIRRDRGESDLARADLEAVLARDPTHAEATVSLAMLLARTGRAADADRLLQDAVERRPPASVTAQLHFTRAFLSSEKGDQAAAIAEYRKAIAAQPDHAESRFNLGVTLHMARRYSEAADAFAEAARLQPANVRAHLDQARAWMAANQWRRARAALESGLERLPGDPVLGSALAEVLAGSPDPAVRDGKRALDLATAAYRAKRGFEHGEAVGMALAELGRFDEAATHQRGLVAEASGASAAVRARLAANLARYERKEPVRIRR